MRTDLVDKVGDPIDIGEEETPAAPSPDGVVASWLPGVLAVRMTKDVLQNRGKNILSQQFPLVVIRKMPS